ncbi:MAG: ComEA family DNA-binding protein [Chloroflexota bacterium]
MPATSDRSLLLIIGGAVLCAVAALGAWLALAPPATDQLASLATPGVPIVGDQLSAAPLPSGELVVDVEGSVATPGLHRLPPGARVADAIEAAGGFGPDADLDAAAVQLNLAAALTDGQQVRVPRIGESSAAGPSGAPGAGGSGGGGLVNLNSATPEELDALPGIGPVTVQKIVAARQEAPFASLDDAVARDVMNGGQLDKIRDLATV